MKIAFITKWYTEGLGYSENKLPWAMKNLGHEVHLISSNTQVYYGSPRYSTIYYPLFGEGIVPAESSEKNGVMVHRLPHRITRGTIGIEGLTPLLESIKPDIIQTFDILTQPSIECSNYCACNSCALFLECHVHRSIFGSGLKGEISRQAHTIRNFLNPDRIALNRSVKMCYAIAPDAAEIATRMFHLHPSKVAVQPLGVDTDVFKPCPDTARREEIRRSFGVAGADFVCAYTGRFSSDKMPQLLAAATDRMEAETGLRVRSLFVGAGSESDTARLRSFRTAIVGDFIRGPKLAEVYWAADAACWPREESTSQLDAMACGIPIIISGAVTAAERTDGCSLPYIEGDSASLCSVLQRLLDPDLRTTMGEIGRKRVQGSLSWSAIAALRAADYSRFGTNGQALVAPL